MRFRSWTLGISTITLGAFALAHACGGDDTSPPPASGGTAGAAGAGGSAGKSGAAGTAGTAGSVGTAGSAGMAGMSGSAGAAGTAGAPGDGGDASPEGAKPIFLAHFPPSQLPEGIWVKAGTPIVGLTQLAAVVTVTAEGGTAPFGSIGEAGAASGSNTLGITTDTAGNVYVGVGTLAAPDAGAIPSPGVYKFPPAGGAGTLFSSAPGMNFPNGLDFVGTTLYVADSEGVVYAIDPAGTATRWSSDALLAPNPTACSSMLPAPIGANGIVHDANAFYVTVSNYGRIVKIPMNADGGAGTATNVVEDCALAGADGLTLDPKDMSLIVAVNVQNKIVRVAMSGQMSVVASGAPLDFPASVVIDSMDAGRRLLFTNAALFSGDAGRPGVLALPIP